MPTNHAHRFRFLLIIYLQISLQLSHAARLVLTSCLTRLAVGAPDGRGPWFLEPSESPIATPSPKFVFNYIQIVLFLTSHKYKFYIL